MSSFGVVALGVDMLSLLPTVVLLLVFGGVVPGLEPCSVGGVVESAKLAATGQSTIARASGTNR